MTDKVFDELARVILGRTGQPPKVKMIGETTPGGTDLDVRANYVPSPLGDEGDVLTVVDSGGDLIAAWAPGSGTGIGNQYRQYLFATDGSGGWGFVEATVSGQTLPVTALFDTE